MPSTNSLTTIERSTLLDDLQRLRSDADQLDGKALLQRFLPLPAHERALSRDVMVVRGERGAGKSMLFKTLAALRDAKQPITSLFARAEDDDVQWLEGFSEKGTSHPTTELVARFVASASSEQVRVMWMAHLVGCFSGNLGRDLPPLPKAFEIAWRMHNEIDAWVLAANAVLPQLATWLDDAHQHLSDTGKEVVVLYDHLDKIGSTSPQAREKATASLLALWLSLSNRYRAIRAKIFVREDLFESSLSGSADASKLRSRSVTLAWEVGPLYRLLIRQMAAQSEGMRHWLEDTANTISLTERVGFGWFPPDPLRELGRPSQAAFVEHLAGKQMGQGPKKGYVYRWIPDRLQDAHGAIVPRSLINLVAYAAENARPAPKASYKRLLHPQELQGALDQTSRQRVDELGEEHAIVYRLRALEGTVVPIDHATLVARLSQRSNRDDSFGDDGEAVATELARIGVLRERERRRWDVPDIYRYGYGIKRKGGVARPR
jgi:hypothetical protein